jgi:hypothetical protein
VRTDKSDKEADRGHYEDEERKMQSETPAGGAEYSAKVVHDLDHEMGVSRRIRAQQERVFANATRLLRGLEFEERIKKLQWAAVAYARSVRKESGQ